MPKKKTDDMGENKYTGEKVCSGDAKKIAQGKNHNSVQYKSVAFIYGSYADKNSAERE